MKDHHRLSLLLPLLVLAACGEDQPPTAPTPPADLGGPAYSVTAGHRVVNSVADPGDGTCNATQCTLREAIKDPGSTEISFIPGLTGPITLAQPAAGGGELVIEKTLTITGPSAGITIRRRSTDPDFRILRVRPGATVTLTNLSLRNGKTEGPGGGIVNYGTLFLVRSTVAGHAAARQGGGIYNHGPLTLTNSTVADNTGDGIDNHNALTLSHSTVARNSGGGIENHFHSTLTVSHSTVTNNSGGGISNSGGTLTLTNSTVAGNSSGGISQSRGTATITNAKIVGNSTAFDGGGIVMDHGNVTLTKSTVAGNSSAGDGGGIANFAGRFTIATSTIANNSATGVGGGIFNTVGDPFGRQDASLTLTNSTVSGNSAASGAGIDNSDRLGGAGLTITNSTVAHNSARNGGGGIHQEDGVENPNPLTFTNSLVAKNTAPTGPDVLGDVSASFSLIGDGTGSSITNTDGNQVGNVSPNSSPIDPRLRPLADNGGPTLTHALKPGSPARDAASTPDCPTTDQRGVLRPQGPACDIGSYERE